MNKVLSLDISSKTGWAISEIDEVANIFKLLETGTLTKESKPDIKYPEDYVVWAQNCFSAILGLINKYNPDVLVIEETSKGSKNNFSQKILEFIHYLVAVHIQMTKIKAHYFMTGEWRRICGCLLTNEEKKRNKEVSKQHSNGVKVVKNAEGKRIGKIGKKHINIRRCNEIFNLGLIRKDEDRADAILLNYSYFVTFYARIV
jgi:hypothetical protein